MGGKEKPLRSDETLERMRREIEREQALRSAREESLRRALRALEEQDDAIEEAGAQLREILRIVETERDRNGSGRQR